MVGGRRTGLDTASSLSLLLHNEYAYGRVCVCLCASVCTGVCGCM